MISVYLFHDYILLSAMCLLTVEILVDCNSEMFTWFFDFGSVSM